MIIYWSTWDRSKIHHTIASQLEVGRYERLRENDNIRVQQDNGVILVKSTGLYCKYRRQMKQAWTYKLWGFVQAMNWLEFQKGEARAGKISIFHQYLQGNKIVPFSPVVAHKKIIISIFVKASGTMAITFTGPSGNCLRLCLFKAKRNFDGTEIRLYLSLICGSTHMCSSILFCLAWGKFSSLFLSSSMAV